MLHRCKQLLKKGGDMTELQSFLLDTMKDVRDGTCPTETAKAIHLTGHRVVMDKFAECKKIDRGMQDVEEAMEAMRDV